ncbi:SOH1-domain-containing protein [Diplogelasinospora grovesii]|uniref:Mediator of RNA polymerase II transcription subunit 31 n=1 Tax=Diplogelasinospora grovesii TaxID=303347 RepID=A0AAN6N8V8_9PEZI|nr:SOH1-domain-containing protein [Diplogelasinospora grovesii]
MASASGTTGAMAPPPLPVHLRQEQPNEQPTYTGFTRFELELEFVQALGNPSYLNHLAARKLLNNPAFIAYLDYLQYWTRPPYLKYLSYPGPALKHLQLLQLEKFRQDIISPHLVQALTAEGMKTAVEYHLKKEPPLKKPGSKDKKDAVAKNDDSSKKDTASGPRPPPKPARKPRKPEIRGG